MGHVTDAEFFLRDGQQYLQPRRIRKRPEKGSNVPQCMVYRQCGLDFFYQRFFEAWNDADFQARFMFWGWCIGFHYHVRSSETYPADMEIVKGLLI